MIEIVYDLGGLTPPQPTLRVNGHALVGPIGNDVVCAAVSTLVQSFELGLKHVARVLVFARQKPGHSYLHWTWDADERQTRAMDAIVMMTMMSLNQLAIQYPDNIKFTSLPECLMGLEPKS